MENEIWKDVVGYEGLYQVSNLGRVRSLDKVISGKNGTPRRLPGKVMKTPIAPNGYPHTALRRDGKSTTLTVHRLVASAFMPNLENKRTVNHIDGNKENNNLENLEWATDKENLKHAWDTGLSKPSNPNKNGKHEGENSPSSILKEEEVMFIRTNCKKNGGNIPMTTLAKTFGVSVGAIQNIIDFKNWKHLGDMVTPIDGYVLSKTGHKYVFANGNRFQGQFSHNKVKYRCGSYGTPEEAHEAVMKKRREMEIE